MAGYIVKKNNEKSEDLQNYVELVNKLDENDQIVNERCKFCKHKLREDAEKVWEQSQHFKPIVEFFKNSGSPDMTMNNVRTHIRNHYLKQEQLILRRQYAERLIPVVNTKLSNLKRIQVLIAMLDDKAWKYASMEHENPMVAMRYDDMLLKVLKEIGNLMSIEKELEGELKPIQIVIDKFQQIVVNAMGKIQDPNLRLEMSKELEALKDIKILEG